MLAVGTSQDLAGIWALSEIMWGTIPVRGCVMLVACTN